MTVGFDRFLRLAWLDEALYLAASDAEVDVARASLEGVVGQELSGKRSQVETARLLQQIWLAPDKAVRPSRDHALSLHRQGGDPLILHWGMAMAVYPFFATVAETAGRQLRLHGSFSLPTLLQRVEERYGARPTVQRAAPARCAVRRGVGGHFSGARTGFTSVHRDGELRRPQPLGQ